MIKVYHAINPTFHVGEVVGLMKLSEFYHVADVATNDLDYAYMLTNSIDSNWWDNAPVTFKGSPQHGMDGCRSTSVGDVMLLDGTYYVVASCGFEVSIMNP